MTTIDGPSGAYGHTGRAELEGRIVRRAASDPSFREALLTNPRAALEAELGIALPAGMTVEVMEERPDRMCIVLPVDLSGLSYNAVWAMVGYPPPVRNDGSGHH